MRGAILAEGVGKRYRQHPPNRANTLAEAILQGLRRTPSTWFWGLRGVSFSVAPGRTVGVIGRNGAGKSSLLRLIGGVGRPDEGRISVVGRVGALLDLGAGLTDDLTGRENAVLVAMIAGMRRSEVLAKLDSIIAFAELEPFIDQPLRSYSSGMRLRLAFAVAIHVEPDILLVDEVLAVGDTAFQRKCLARIEDIKQAGCTIFFVSHDESMIHALCDEVLYLRRGEVVAFGPTAEVMARYRGDTDHAESEPVREVAEVAVIGGRRLRLHENRFGTQEAQIAAVRLLDAAGAPAERILSGAALTVEMDCRRMNVAGGVVLGVTICTEDDTPVFDTNTALHEVDVLVAETEGRFRLEIARLDLVPGRYFVDVGLYEADWERLYDRHTHVYELEIVGIGYHSGKGVLAAPCAWQRDFSDAEQARPGPAVRMSKPPREGAA
ncbi:ABC transporter ATP-binding protein [Frigidibacter sp. MR17.24]|uniref:ABC transporter ATP-binding protein n=1 Tax=Frigidibacter sp. MR17.24 TaxID=3127345 RepID=UPI003013191A